MEGKFVSYLRVSTSRQGESGLGLDAQREAVEDFLNGGNWSLEQEFLEVETGKGANALAKRPVLAEAIEYCRKNGAVLVIAKLDRLARNVAFVSALMESGIEFLCADNPHASRLTLHVLAAVAEHEREQISQRTKAALQAAKARGTRLGNPQLAKLHKRQRKQAREFAESMRPVLEDMAGLSQRLMVEQLNAHDIPTARGGTWSLIQLQRVLKKLAA